MGLGNDGDPVAGDGKVGAGDTDGCGGKSFCAVSCSICLEVVADSGDRSWAKLQCGHKFHVDCIGSAFNVKGAMQCPNCRKIEKGQWLYSNGCRVYPELNMDAWMHDEDLYDLSYSEMSFGVHWCPFGSLARLPSTIEEWELSTPYHDILGQHAILSESAALSSAGHPCPYVAYFGAVHPSSSTSSGSVSEGSNFASHWEGQTMPNEMSPSYAFPAVDLHYHSWEHHSLPFPASSGNLGGTDTPPLSSGTLRLGRESTDLPRQGSFMHPFLVGQSSTARTGSSVGPSVIPHYPGSNARARDRVEALQAYYQQQQPGNSTSVRTHITSATRRLSSQRGSVQVLPASSSDNMGAYCYIPSGASGRSLQEQENAVPNRFHAWEREHVPRGLSINQLDRESNWGAFLQSGGPDPGIRANGGFRLRHGSEGTPSQHRDNL